ncbi:MAG: response regulator [Treponema sp.]|nr:response regulator [Treponema sp.]
MIEKTQRNKRIAVLPSLVSIFVVLMGAFQLLDAILSYQTDELSMSALFLDVFFSALFLLILLVVFINVSHASSKAFVVPLLLFCFFTTQSIFVGGFPYFYTVCFCIAMTSALYYHLGSFLLYLAFSYAVVLALLAMDIPLAGAVSFKITVWGFSTYAVSSMLLYIIVKWGAKTNARQRDYLLTLLKSPHTSTVLLDKFYRVYYISAAMAKYFKIKTPDLIIGMPVIDVVNSLQIKRLLAEMISERYVGTENSFETIWELDMEDGRPEFSGPEKRYLQVFCDELPDRGSGRLLGMSDITPIMQAKIAAERADMAKNTFLAKTSHEIRTPMNAIMGMVELILQKDTEMDVHENALYIKQAGLNLISIINDILDFSKVESGKMELEEDDYLFASFIHDTVNIMRVRLIDKPVLFLTDIDSKLPKRLRGDVVRVRQILLNILGNSVKFTEQGFISLAVVGTLEDETHIRLKFTASDTGIGIRAEDMHKLFTDFVQLDPSRSANNEGTGLGLIVSRKICYLMNGDISVESEYGKGSTFTIELVQEVRDPEPFAYVASEEQKRILIYAKRRVYADSVACSIANLGTMSKIVSDSEQFVAALETDVYDFIFIESFLFLEAYKIAQERGSQATFVILKDLNETSLYPNISTITMPASVLSIANILNGEGENGFIEDGMQNLRFIAPSARVLVVDDVATNLKVAKGLMSSYHLQIECVLSGIDAVRAIRESARSVEKRFDIVFMDHMMPGMDGIEALKAIRAMGNDEYFQSVPVVMLTANAVMGMKDMFLANGFNDYISKPIDIARLDEILARWIPSVKKQKMDNIPTPYEETDSFSIEGIDAQKGLNMAGGSMKVYKEILATYVKDVNNRLPMLYAFGQSIKTATPDEKSLSLFVTHVHALKSASAGIGALALSSEALALETAGRNVDTPTIRQNLNAFCENLSSLIDRIESVMPKPDEDDGEAVAEDDKKEFFSLKEALQNENIGVIDSIFDAITRRRWGSNIQKRLSLIGDSILLSEFDEAVKILDELIG